MATGLKSNNAIEQGYGVSWEDKWGIDLDDFAVLTRSNFHVKIVGNEVYSWAEGLYTGTTDPAADLASLLDNLPIGSWFLAPAYSTPAIYMKTASSTWKLQAINT